MQRRLLNVCSALAVGLATQAYAQNNLDLSIVPFQGSNVTGAQVIDAEVFLTINSGSQNFNGVNIDVPCSVGFLTVVDIIAAHEASSSLGGVPTLFTGSPLGGDNVPACTLFQSKGIGAPATTRPAGTYWLGTYKVQVGDCATGDTVMSFENYTSPPAATDQTKIRDGSAGQGLLMPFDVIPMTLSVVVGTCCNGTTCLTDGVNEYCCENGLWGGPAGSFNPGVTCASPNACACTNDAQCDDGNLCNGAETCNLANGQCVPGTALNCDDGNVCTDDGCNPSTGCTHANNTGPCGSGADTDCDNPDSCLNGGCVPNFEPAGTACGDPADTECDNPDTCNGSGTCQPNNVAGACTDDGNQCTDDLCAGGACTHPNDDTNACSDGLNCTTGDACSAGVCGGTPPNCDDGLVCTLDTCDEAGGGCVNTDINTIPCDGPEDCFGAECDAGAGHCVCTENPDLTLEPQKDENGANCHDEGETVCVDVHFGGTPATLQIAGGQFRVTYDPSCLDFVSAVPGDVPWTNEMYESVDEVNGVIFYAVGSPVGGPGPKGSNLPGDMATFCFTKIGFCNECELCLSSLNPQNTYLVTVKGQQVDPETLGCSKTIFDEGPITSNCPDDADVNSDCMASTANVTWDPIAFVDECDGLLDHVCTCEQIDGELIPGGCDYLASAGGVFPQGRFAFTCSAQDDNCNETSTCSWTVKVSDEQTLNVKLQLSPIVSGDEFTRCICFELFSSCTPLVYEEHCETITFGGPFEFDGQATASVKVPKGKYVCIQVRDRQHSLRSTDAVTFDCVGSVYTANFKGDPFFGGNWLIQGNLNRDRVIDILDFGTFLGQLNQNPTPDPKTCEDNDGEGFTHADFNGDGVVDIADFTFIQINFLAHDKADCCHPATAADPVALSEVSVKQLREMGLGDLAIADLNSDGFVNTDDMSLFLQGARPKAAKGTRGNTSRIGSAK